LVISGHEQTLIERSIAAVRLHQTSRSCIAQHFVG